MKHRLNVYPGEFNLRDFNYLPDFDPKEPAKCNLEIGGMYAMRVDGQKWVRVILVSLPELNENQELRAHAVVLEDNPYVKAGVECRPLAFTLSEIPTLGR